MKKLSLSRQTALICKKSTFQSDLTIDTIMLIVFICFADIIDR